MGIQARKNHIEYRDQPKDCQEERSSSMGTLSVTDRLQIHHATRCLSRNRRPHPACHPGPPCPTPSHTERRGRSFQDQQAGSLKACQNSCRDRTHRCPKARARAVLPCTSRTTRRGLTLGRPIPQDLDRAAGSSGNVSRRHEKHGRAFTSHYQEEKEA